MKRNIIEFKERLEDDEGFRNIFVNAANLDGGGSTVLYYDGEIKNKISSIYGARGVPTAIVVK